MELEPMATRVDLSGQRFVRLLVQREGGPRIQPNGQRKRRWVCLCDCGKETLVEGSNLTTGNTTSCGCWDLERRIKHGCGGSNKTPEYRSWRAMRQRCTNPNNSEWPRYGGRGITVCERWDSFERFLADMGPRPAGHSIDRIDNEQGYSPANCRWATTKQQNRNRRDNRWITFRGERRLRADVAEELGVLSNVLQGRIRLGWPEERWGEWVFDRRHIYEFEPGRYALAKTLAARYDITAGAFRERVRAGWPPSRWGEPSRCAA